MFDGGKLSVVLVFQRIPPGQKLSFSIEDAPWDGGQRSIEIWSKRISGI